MLQSLVMKQNAFWRQSRGFSLSEIMVVIAIIGIMLTVALPSISAVRQNSRIKAETATVGKIMLSLVLYRDFHEVFPPGVNGSLVDSCTMCRLAPGGAYDYSLVDTRWQAVAAQLVGLEGGSTRNSDEWGHPYAYDNNYRVADTLRYTTICSMGPDGVLNTTGAPWLTNLSPAAAGDDICHFFK